MTALNANWKVFEDDRFGLRCRYPATTPLGKPVIIRETERPAMLRAHLVSQDSQEVYFEITCYFGLPAGDVFRAHREELEQRFVGLVLTPLEKAELAARQALRYSFDWQQGRRVAFLVETGANLHRILYNPDLPLNARILETIKWLD